MSADRATRSPHASGSARAPLLGAERVLVMMPSWVGDITMATPLLRALRAALPHARVAALLRPGLGAILDGSPWIDERFEAPMRGIAGPWTGLRTARAFGADAVLLLPNSLRSALAALRLGRRRIGHSSQLRAWTLTSRVTPPSRWIPSSAVDNYAALGEHALGVVVSDCRTELFVTDAERTASDRLLEGLDRFLLINPGANRVDKRWPAARFAEAARSIAQEHGLGIAVTGSRAEAALVSSVVAALRTPADVSARSHAVPSAIVDLTARGISLGSLKAVLRRATLLLTNDTGPRHLAAALGTPSIVLFGPTDHRWTTLTPAQAQRDRLMLAEPFLPEPLQADDFDDVCHIDRIAVGDVVAAARSALRAGASPSTVPPDSTEAHTHQHR